MKPSVLDPATVLRRRHEKGDTGVAIQLRIPDSARDSVAAVGTGKSPSGIAGAPELHLEPKSTINFGCVNLGSSKSETVMLVNGGELDTKFQVCKQ